MCECGCTMNDKHYTFPGPGESYYLLTLSGDCRDCDAPCGVTLELLEPGTFKHEYYQQRDHIDGKLKFEPWADSKGVAIITGFRMHEFVAALKSQLVGVSADEMGENGAIDDAGAAVILEEMYEDAQITPFLVKPKRKRRSQRNSGNERLSNSQQ